jgi:hypothetical protein
MKNEDLLLGFIIIVFSIFGLCGALRLPDAHAAVSTSFYPVLLFTSLGICGILLTVKGLSAKKEKTFPILNIGKILPIIGLVILYVVLLLAIGYILSTIIFVISLMFLLGVRKKWQLFGVPICTSLFLYFTFVYGFNIYLP